MQPLSWALILKGMQDLWDQTGGLEAQRTMLMREKDRAAEEGARHLDVCGGRKVQKNTYRRCR